jgi:hypothetical protein
MKFCHLMRVVGLVGMSQHGVDHGGCIGRQALAVSDDGCFRSSFKRRGRGQGTHADIQLDPGYHRGEGIDDMMLCLLDNRVRNSATGAACQKRREILGRIADGARFLHVPSSRVTI